MELDFATETRLARVESKLDALLELLSTARPADDYLTVLQVATLTNTSERTVRSWISDGKPGLKGRVLKLYTLEFSAACVRVPRSALVAFGEGMGFDAAQLRLPTPVPAVKPKRRALPEESPHMSIAS